METQFIDWLRDRLPAHPQLSLGVGDDAALLNLADRSDCVVTSDLLADGVHFELDQCGAPKVGWKSLAVNLSDLAAMAARPVAATVSLLLPRAGGGRIARELIEGMLPLAEQHNVAIAGGDTNSWDGRLVVSVTAIGQSTEHGSWRRGGARPGDWLLVTGQFGGSLLGRHLDFPPRVKEALLLNSSYRIHAAIDVSDGLSHDVARMARASGCGALLDLQRIPVSDAARRAAEKSGDATRAIESALGDGEDFELALAVAPDEAQRLLADQPLAIPLTEIGRFIDDPGLWQHTGDGEQIPLTPRGFEHRLDS